MNIIDFVYDIILIPKTFFDSLAGKSKLSGWAFLLLLFSVFTSMVSIPVVLGMNREEGVLFISAFTGFRYIVTVVLILLWSLILNFTAEILNGKGKAVGMFNAVMFSTFPLVFSIPAGFISLMVPSGYGVLLFMILMLCLILWMINLQLISISSIHGVSYLRAVGVISIPAAVITALFLLITIVGVIILSTIWAMAVKSINIRPF
ncbi:MAG: YIP1 family protein [Elusimicrobiota bacterium]